METNKENSNVSNMQRSGRLTTQSLNDTQRIADSSRLTFKAGPLTKPVTRSAVGSASDARDLQKDLDTLRKELERKDARNANLTSELQTLRTSYSTTQREIRMLSGTFEKVNADRQRLSTELVKCKEYKDKLESQLSRLGDVQYLTSQAERFQTDRDHLEMELGNFRSLLAARDDRIKSLERDLEIFHRSIDIQAQYEGTLGTRTGNSLGAAAPSGRETIAMKSLYYELGKRQTDAHSLAISLASSNQELVALRDSLRDATEARSEALGDLERLRQHCAQLTQQSVKDKDELAALQDKHHNVKSLANRLQGQVEELSRRLTEERLAFEKERAEREKALEDSKMAQHKAQLDVKGLRGRIDALQNSLSQADSVKSLTEKKLATEWSKLSAEMEVMAEKARRVDLLEGQLDSARKRLSEALAAKEEALGSLRALGEAETTQAQIESMSLEAEQSRARVSELLHDKEQSVAALQQTMDAARELNSRLHAEKAKRAAAEERLAAAEERAQQAERVAENLNRAREHVSTAVLDALHKERLKTAQLEKTVAHLAGESPLPPAPVPTAVTATVPPLALGVGSRTIADELTRLRNEIKRIEETAPDSLSD